MKSSKCRIKATAGVKVKTAGYGGCSHGIKRCLCLRRKVMTNLDSILKSRGVTLPTKVHLVKAMVFSSGHVWMDVRAGL